MRLGRRGLRPQTTLVGAVVADTFYPYIFIKRRIQACKIKICCKSPLHTLFFRSHTYPKSALAWLCQSPNPE